MAFSSSFFMLDSITLPAAGRCSGGRVLLGSGSLLCGVHGCGNSVVCA